MNEGRKSALHRPGAVAVAAAWAVFQAVIGIASAQQPLYRERFLEEIKKKPPEIIIPAPTAAEFNAPPAPKALPIELSEARAFMGLEGSGGAAAARLPGGKLGIIDFGFRGLKQWLAGHPEERGLTTYEGNPDLSREDEADHGYWVYRVARAVFPDVPIFLYKVNPDGVPGNGATTVEGALLGGASKGVTLFNMSLGYPSAFQIADLTENWISHKLRMYLVQREAFLFVSIGNSRRATHSWVSADQDKNGYVDFYPYSAQRKIINGLRVVLQPGKNTILFTWNVQQDSEAAYEVELVTYEGHTLAVGRVDPELKRKGYIRLTYDSTQSQPTAVRVRRLAGPASGIFMRLSAYPIAVPEDFNGLQTALAYVFRDNPFVTFVGSFGKIEGGALAPSAFSDIGRGPDGKVHPHVLGPGQLLIDGKEINGTSFAAPFITALYATRSGYNLKNLIERSASHSFLARGVAAHERSRWGVPDVKKIAARLQEITGPTKVENVSHQFEGEELVVRFAVTRCCMEGLTWFVFAALTDPQTNKFLIDNATKAPIWGIAKLRSDQADYVRHPVEVRIPLKQLKPFKGRSVNLEFAVSVHLWRHLAPTPVDVAQRYQITLRDS